MNPSKTINHPPVIAIDGPAGAGKGSLARSLAKRLHYVHLDTGLLYRAIGAGILRSRLDPDDPQSSMYEAGFLKTRDLTDPYLRTEAVADVTSKIAAFPDLRACLLDYQREFGRNPVFPDGQKAPGSVIDGRDIGSVVFPEAVAKFYVSASLEVRAKRRLKELREKNDQSIYTEVLREMQVRDERDCRRSLAPLSQAPTAFEIDSTFLDPQAVLRVAMRHLACLGLIPPAQTDQR